MVEKKSERIIFIILLIMIIFVFFFTIINITNRKKEENKYDLSRLTVEYNKNNQLNLKQTLDKVVEKNRKEAQVQEEIVIDVTDDKVLEQLFIDIDTLVNNHEYSKLLEYYNKQYIDEFQITEEQLQDKFKFDYPISSTLNIKRDKCTEDRVIVTARMLDDHGRERIYDFTVFNDGSIADLPLYKEVELNKVTERDDVTYTLKKKYITRLGSIFLLNVDNKSECLVDIQDIKGTQGSSFKYDHELINGNIYSYQITPERSKDLIIKIFNQEKPDDIIITNKKYDGTIENFSILAKKEEVYN